MEISIAPAEQTIASALLRELDIIENDPVITALLKNNNSLMAILNENRQVLAINDGFLDFLGETDASAIIGQRIGEVIGCIHAHDKDGGCGTGDFCVSCGAAAALVSTLTGDSFSEQNCAITIEKNGILSDLFLRIHCSSLVIAGSRFLLLFIEDITMFQKWAAMERTFFHDITNITAALLSASELVMDLKSPPPLAQNIYHLVKRLANEIEVQRCLVAIQPEEIRLKFEQVHLETVIRELKSMAFLHPAAMNKTIHFPPSVPIVSFSTDFNLLLRVLYNMVINAIEATENGGEIRITVEQHNEGLSFTVWNKSPVPPAIAKRIFQRFVSDKPGHGRGMGTYSMKLFGEELLGGKVEFMSSEKSGTTFTYIMPV